MMAMLIKLLEINMVASNRDGRLSNKVICLWVGFSLSSMVLILAGESEKKATSDPEIKAEHTSKSNKKMTKPIVAASIPPEKNARRE